MKKWISALLLVCLCIGLVGCGNTTPPEAVASPTPEAPTGEPGTPEKTEEPSAFDTLIANAKEEGSDLGIFQLFAVIFELGFACESTKHMFF